MEIIELTPYFSNDWTSYMLGFQNCKHQIYIQEQWRGPHLDKLRLFEKMRFIQPTSFNMLVGELCLEPDYLKQKHKITNLASLANKVCAIWRFCAIGKIENGRFIGSPSLYISFMSEEDALMFKMRS